MSRLERPALTGKPLKRGARLVIAATAAALLSTALAPASFAQAPLVENVAKQPLTVHVEGLMEALTFLGRPLPEAGTLRRRTS